MPSDPPLNGLGLTVEFNLGLEKSGKESGNPVISKEEYYSKITINQTSRLNFDKFGRGNYIPDCRSAPFP